MDNTRFASNGSSRAITMNEKTFKSTCLPSTQKTTCHYDQLKKPHINTGPMYTMCGGGAQVLMNTQSIVTATNLQFLPPMRQKTTFCGGTTIGTKLPLNSTVYYQSTSFATQKLTLSTMLSTRLSLAEQHQNLLTQNVNADKIEHTKLFNSNVINNNNSSKSPVNESEGKTFVNSIKSFFSSLIKPIIDTTTMIVGSDTTMSDNKSSTTTASQFWSQTNQTDNSMHSRTIESNFNHSNGSGSCFIENSNIYMDNVMPDVENVPFFDCDDYIEGGEDTVDFVADSTKEQWQFEIPQYFDNITVEEPSPKDSVYYDCINQLNETDEKMDTFIYCDPIALQTDRNAKIEREAVQCKNVQHNETLPKKNYPKLANDIVKNQKPTPANAETSAKIMEKSKMPPQNVSSQRKNRRKRKDRCGNQNHMEYRHKGTAPAKNRHEKLRHELDMAIHDDLDDCVLLNKNGKRRDRSWYDDDVDTDIEIIDIDTQTPESSTNHVHMNTSSNLKITEIASTSPEKIPSGCIFTSFFRFGCRKLKPIPSRFEQKPVQSTKSPQERAPICHRLSETESDDSFIVFDDDNCSKSPSVDEVSSRNSALRKSYVRQRQLSECSDDFICFENDSNDGRDYDESTGDEDFSDSTDDTDDSDDSDTDSGKGIF